MQGREFAVRPDLTPDGSSLFGERLVAHLTRQERTREPLRRRVKEWCARVKEWRNRLQAAITGNDPAGVDAVIAELSPNDAAPCEPWFHWVERLWQASDPWAIFQLFWHEPQAPVGLAIALLHLRDPQRF